MDASSVVGVDVPDSSVGRWQPTNKTTTTAANRVKKYMRFISVILRMQPSISHSSTNRKHTNTPDALCWDTYTVEVADPALESS